MNPPLDLQVVDTLTLDLEESRKSYSIEIGECLIQLIELSIAVEPRRGIT